MSEQAVDALMLKPLEAVAATARDLRAQVDRTVTEAAEKARAEIERQRIELDGRILAWEALAAQVEQRRDEADSARRQAEQRLAETEEQLGASGMRETKLTGELRELEKLLVESREETMGIRRELRDARRDAQVARVEAAEAGDRLKEAIDQLNGARQEATEARRSVLDESRARMAAEASLAEVLGEVAGAWERLGRFVTARAQDAGAAVPPTPNPLEARVTPEPASDPAGGSPQHGQEPADTAPSPPPPSWQIPFEAAPVLHEARSPLRVGLGEQLGTYWIPGTTPLELLAQCVDWVLFRSPGRRRTEADPEWTSEGLTAGGDFTSDVAIVRVRRTVQAERWALHFMHLDARSRGSVWHHAFEAFEDGGGVTVRHVGGLEPGRGEAPKAPVTPPRFVATLWPRCEGALRAGSAYRADAEHLLAAGDAGAWVSEEVLAPNRQHALVLAGARCAVPPDCWHPSSPIADALLPSCLIFRLVDEAAAKAVAKALRGAGQGSSRMSGAALDAGVYFIGRRGVIDHWDEAQGRAVVSYKDLHTRVTRLLLRADDRWPSVVEEFQR